MTKKRATIILTGLFMCQILWVFLCILTSDIYPEFPTAHEIFEIKASINGAFCAGGLFLYVVSYHQLAD